MILKRKRKHLTTGSSEPVSLKWLIKTTTNQLNASDINFSKELNAGSYESLVWPITMSTVFSMSYFQQVMAYFQEEEKKIYWIIVDHSIIMLNSDFPGFETYRQWVIHWYWGGGVWCLLRIQQYFSYIVAVSFIGGRNWSTGRRPLPCCSSLTNFFIQYALPARGSNSQR